MENFIRDHEQIVRVNANMTTGVTTVRNGRKIIHISHLSVEIKNVNMTKAGNQCVFVCVCDCDGVCDMIMLVHAEQLLCSCVSAKVSICKLKSEYL